MIPRRCPPAAPRGRSAGQEHGEGSVFVGRVLGRRRGTAVVLGLLVIASVVCGIPPVRHAVRSAIPFLRPHLAVSPLTPGSSTSRVGILSTPDGNGYWVLQADAGIFTFGDAEFHGSNGGQSIPSFARGLAALS